MLDRILEATDASKTISEVSRKTGHSRGTVRKVLVRAGFDFTKFRPYRGRMPEDKHVFYKSDKRRNATVLSHIRRQNLLPDLCSVCGLPPEWNGKPLKLQLDHIDGNAFNNEFDNLRIICPNCHTQTDTFTGRNVK